MNEGTDQPPTDLATLQTLLPQVRAERDVALAERDAARAERDHFKSQNGRMQHLLQQLRRAQFGRSSEKLDPDQLQLAFEDIEQAIAATEAEDDKTSPVRAHARAEKRRTNRGALPAHLPRVHVTVAPDDTKCPCCQAPMHVIGEESSERLDVIPAQYRVLVTHAPNMVAGPASRRLFRRRRLNG